MLTYVEFKSAAFPPYDRESEQINPGRFGKRLAEYLSAELSRRGEQIGELFTEDWGWVVPIQNAGFDLWIGVGNYDEYPEGFLCFIEPHTEYVRKLLKKIPTRDRIEALQRSVAAVLQAHANIRDLKWSTHEEFNSAGA
jgi:hypothetical protein